MTSTSDSFHKPGFQAEDKPPPKLLLVEENANIRTLVADFLTHTGFSVLEAASRADAEAWREIWAHGKGFKEVSAIICDVDLGPPPLKGDGLRLYQDWQARGRLPAFLFMSAYASPRPEAPVWKAGVGWIKKPFVFRRLVELVELLQEEAAAAEAAERSLEEGRRSEEGNRFPHPG